MHCTLAKQKASCFQAYHKQAASLNGETVLLKNILLGILIPSTIFLDQLVSINHLTNVSHLLNKASS